MVQVLLQVTVLEESLAQPCPALPCPRLEGPPWVGSKPRYGTGPWFKAARRPGPLARSCLRASETLIVEKGPGHPYHLPTP